jgi:hypothetical protein
MIDTTLMIIIGIAAPFLWVWKLIKKFLVWIGLMEEEKNTEVIPPEGK